VSQADIAHGRVRLRVNQPHRSKSEFFADHVIAATGFRVNLESIPFLDPSLLTRVRHVRYGPALSAHFESSVTGLYFVGYAAAETFGPVMRFVYGADFTVRRLTSHLQNHRNGRRSHTAGMRFRRCRDV